MSRMQWARRRGLTLIELVVVLAILVGLAGLIVPRLDFLKTQADHATAAATSADLASMLQTYKTTSRTKTYPTLDLLVDGSGGILQSVWSTDGNEPFDAWTVPNPGAPGTSWYLSLLEGGLTKGFANTGTNASNSSSTTESAIGAGATLAELNYDVGPGSHPYVSSIVSQCFPGQTIPPTGVKLIGLGVGPTNPMVGTVMVSTPLETQGDDPTQVYCRHIAIFAVYGDGRPAQLKMVVDHRLKQIDKRIDQYNKTL